jgi:predicted nucleotidyltransferase
MDHDPVHQAFTAALDGLIAQVRKDRSIVAAILCGSLSHDTVWARSDIDLVLVTIDDRDVKRGGIALNADGVNVHAFLVPRTEFRRVVEGSVQNSFMHSLLVKGRLVFTHDETITSLCRGLTELGSRDREIQVLRAATGALPAIYKAHKWLVTRGDLNYTALWILYAATPLAEMEVVGAGLVADREVIPHALALNPAFFRVTSSGTSTSIK